MDHLKTLYEQLLIEPFPSHIGKKLGNDDLSLVDSDLMKISSKFFDSKGHLKAVDIKVLGECYKKLKRIVPELDKSERQYFASMKQLAKEMLEFASRSKLSESEIELRYKWKKVYGQIKIIVNELDPLGVSGFILEEYDDLNFKIYSQLIQSKDERKLFETIKTFVKKYYHTDLTDDEVAKAVNQLIKIKT